MKRDGTTWLPKVHFIGAKLRHVVKPIRVGDGHIEPHFPVEEDKLDYCCGALTPSRALQKLCRIRRSGIVNASKGRQPGALSPSTAKDEFSHIEAVAWSDNLLVTTETQHLPHDARCLN